VSVFHASRTEGEASRGGRKEVNLELMHKNELY